MCYRDKDLQISCLIPRVIANLHFVPYFLGPFKSGWKGLTHTPLNPPKPLRSHIGGSTSDKTICITILTWWRRWWHRNVFHITSSLLRWRHNEYDGDSNHQRFNCLLNRFFRPRWKKTSKLRVTGLCEGNSPVTCEFPAQRLSKTEKVFIWWRRHVMRRIQRWPVYSPQIGPVLWSVDIIFFDTPKKTLKRSPFANDLKHHNLYVTPLLDSHARNNDSVSHDVSMHHRHRIPFVKKIVN